jgi:hypothetical protein
MDGVSEATTKEGGYIIPPYKERRSGGLTLYDTILMIKIRDGGKRSDRKGERAKPDWLNRRFPFTIGAFAPSV